ncbi:MAG TPA: metalloregulator ArsR/SmtB family transcription factor [Planktothrix sp.]|jgi:DNA-binding transcriptional ArsR family regulator
MLNYSDQLDVVFQALSDPTRRYMVEQLSRSPASVSELARPLPVSLPAVVQHLQVLEASGLVRSEKNGRIRTCRINPDVLTAAQSWIDQQKVIWEQRFDRLEEFLQEEPTEPTRKKARNKEKKK